MRGVPEALIKSLSIRDGFIVIKANSTTMPFYVAFTVAFFILNRILYLIAERTQVCLIGRA